MTNNNPTPDLTPSADATREQILSRYANLTFVPAYRPARRELNFSRGASNRASRATRTIR